jgi:hypothetical protein
MKSSYEILSKDDKYRGIFGNGILLDNYKITVHVSRNLVIDVNTHELTDGTEYELENANGIDTYLMLDPNKELVIVTPIPTYPAVKVSDAFTHLKEIGYIKIGSIAT